MNIYPIGNNLTVKWTLRYSDGTVFPLSLYDYELSYRTSRGVKVATDTAVEDNVLRWMLKADDQVVSGPYSLALKITLAGNKAVDLQYNNAFALTPLCHGNGSNIEVSIESNCDVIDLKDAVLQSRKAMDLAAGAVKTSTESAKAAVAAQAAAEKVAGEFKNTAQEAQKAAQEAQQSAQEATVNAQKAQASAATASEHITSLNKAIAELPDGQAVSEKVAEHTVKINELSETTTAKFTKLESEVSGIEDSIAEVWTPDSLSTVGRIVVYNGSRYKCIHANDNHDWIPSNWSKIPVQEDLATISDTMGAVAARIESVESRIDTYDNVDGYGTIVDAFDNASVKTFHIGPKSVIKTKQTKQIGLYPTNGTMQEKQEYVKDWLGNMRAVTIAGGKKYDPIQIIGSKTLRTSYDFLDITADGKVWFGIADFYGLAYYDSVDSMMQSPMTLNVDDIRNPDANTGIHVVKVGFPAPVHCLRMNYKGELIVVCDNIHEGFPRKNKCSIWKSDNNFQNWSQKMEFDNKYVSIADNDQLCDIKGDRIVVAGYGARGNSDDYADINKKAAWSIYYSPDCGDTWYNRIFDLGNVVDIHYWKYESLEGNVPAGISLSYGEYIRRNSHIHGVFIDEYRNALVVMVGDYNRAIYTTTNLSEWDSDEQRLNTWSVGTEHTLHWLRIPVEGGLDGGNRQKPNNGIALPECYIFGSDGFPNSIFRMNINHLLNEDTKTELAWTKENIAFQLSENDDFGFYGGQSMYRRSPSKPILITMEYIGDTSANGVKRNIAIATNDGYTFSEIWCDDSDLSGKTFFNIIRMDDDGNVLIVTADTESGISSYNKLIIGKLTC